MKTLIKRFTLHRGVTAGLFVCVALYIVVKVKTNLNGAKNHGDSQFLESETMFYQNTGSRRKDYVDSNDRDKAIVSLAQKISMHNKTVLVSVVNDAFLPFAYSWLCNTKQMGVHKSVLVITNDIESKRNLTRDWPDITVFHITLDISKGDQDYSHVGYVKIMIRRTEVILSLLMSDIELLLLEFDYTWFSNPVPTLQRFTGADILVNPVSNTHGVYNGGFLYLFATERTKALWTKVTLMMRKLGEDIKNKPDTKVISEGENDQVYLSHLIQKKYSGIEIKLLPLDTYADGKWYSMTEAERGQIHPTVLSNNWVVGNKNKMTRAKKFGHWFLKEDRTCDTDAVRKIVRRTN